MKHARPGCIAIAEGFSKRTINMWIAQGILTPLMYGGKAYVEISQVKKEYKKRKKGIDA